MSSDEKAKELVEVFAETIPPKIFGVLMERDWETAKQCALIAVDEILSLKMIYAMSRNDKYSEGEFYEKVEEKIKSL